MIRLILAITQPSTIFQMANNYEQELHKCIQSWRQNAGTFKTIPIEVFSTYDLKLDYPNCTAHVNPQTMYHEDKLHYSIVHQAGLFFQELFPNDTLIHIDIDMYITKQFPLSLLKHDTLVGAYDGMIELDCPRRYRLCKQFGITKMVNTDFIITKPQSTFYQEYFKCFETLKQQIDTDFWAFEEFVADCIVHKNNYDTITLYENCYTPIGDLQ